VCSYSEDEMGAACNTHWARRNAYCRIVVGKTEGTRRTCWREDTIKTDDKIDNKW
jgi:hypothetical protein